MFTRGLPDGSSRRTAASSAATFSCFSFLQACGRRALPSWVVRARASSRVCSASLCSRCLFSLVLAFVALPSWLRNLCAAARCLWLLCDPLCGLRLPPLTLRVPFFLWDCVFAQAPQSQSESIARGPNSMPSMGSSSTPSLPFPTCISAGSGTEERTKARPCHR